MRNELSSLDLKFLASELRALVGGVIQKAWQEGRQLRFEIFLPSKGTFELLFEPGKIFMTEYRRKAPDFPEAFALSLRKHLSGQRIKDIRQPGFERIIEVVTENATVILETFSKGNAILCGKDGNIVSVLELQTWKGRKLAPKVKYQYPPQIADPFSLPFEQFYPLMRQSDKEIVRFLAADLSFSGLYAEEICARAELPKNIACKAVSKDEAKKLFEIFHNLPANPYPCIVFDGKAAVDAVPIKMKLYEKLRNEPFANFTSALDEYFTHRENVAEALAEKATAQAEYGKLERIMAEQKTAVGKWKKKEKDCRRKAEAIQNNFELVDKVISGIEKAHAAKIPWAEIKKRAKEENTAAAKAIKSIDEKTAELAVRLGKTEVEINFRRSARQNADFYFEQAKHAAKKFEASKLAAVGTKKQHTSVKKKELNRVEKPAQPRKRARGKWFEKFHWMTTSDGFLVVGGRDATQNEVLFKKHLSPDDIALHADITGAPLTFVKADGKEPSPIAIREAGEFAVAYSSGWKRGLASVDVYWVRAEQVSKTAVSGEFLPKGSFMMRGSKNFMKNMELKVAVGIEIIDVDGQRSAKPVCGAVQSVNSRAKYFVTLKPGSYSQQQTAEEIRKRLLVKALPGDQVLIKEIDLGEFQRLVPAGHSSIIG